MANKPDRIVLDTNILVYFLISNSFQKLDKSLNTNKARLLFSEELLQEFLLVVSWPKFKKYFSDHLLQSPKSMAISYFLSLHYI